MLSQNELRNLVPAAFADAPATHCSPNYVFFNTQTAIKALAECNFLPVRAQQDRTKVHAGHARHMITFRMPHAPANKATRKLGDLTPEVRIINSSDGSSRFHMQMGLYRLICLNGCVVAVRGMPNMSAIAVHKKVDAAAIIAEANRITASAGPLFERVASWQKIMLPAPRIESFARAAAEIRWNDKATSYTVTDLAAPQRDEDKQDNLWNVFNRVQENGMRGGTVGRNAAGRAVRSRAIASIDGEMDFNTRLWELAETYAVAA